MPAPRSPASDRLSALGSAAGASAGEERTARYAGAELEDAEAGGAGGGTGGRAVPSSGGPKGRRRTPALLAAIVVIAVVAGSAYLGGRGLLPWQSRGPVTPTPSPQSPKPSVSPSSAIPPGYHTVTDEVGFTVVLPKGWTRSEQETDGDINVHYVAPDHLTSMLISVVPTTTIETPLHHWNDLEKTLSLEPGYDRLELRAERVRLADGSLRAGAIWEWTWMGKTQEYHDIDLGFDGDGGKSYALNLSTPAVSWTAEKPVFDVARNTFTFGD